MASVVSERHGGRTRYRIQFRDGNKRRRSIRLSGLTRKAAESIRSRVETLNACRIAGQPLDTATSRWVADLGDDLHEKLAAAGLFEPRQRATLGGFIDGYIRSRSEAAANTIRNWRDSRRKLTDFLGVDRDLRTITPGDADDWRQSLVDAKYSESTISKAVKHAKQFMKAAVRKGYATSNPFRELKASGEHNESRKQFVDHKTIRRVLEACPDLEWRLIIALARYGGLRCPSEVLDLEWQHIDWQSNRFSVTSRKTKRQGKPFRTVPMFPELRPFLDAAFEQADEGSRYVVTRYRHKNANLRTQLLRIIRKAGVEPWDRLFQNLRASRETELANNFPLHVVTAWLGNTPKVATDHYLQVTDDHYTQATQGVVQQVVPQPTAKADIDRSGSQSMRKKTRVNGGSAKSSGFVDAVEYPLGESNPCLRTENPMSWATRRRGRAAAERVCDLT